MCLGHRGLPERALDEAIIAFAADSIDPVTRTGWSVQVQGRSVVPPGLRIDTGCGWPTAPAQVVQIESGKISGHWMHLCPFVATALAASRQLPTGAAPDGYPWPPLGRRDRKT